MASLNLSTNGPSIAKSYQSVVNAPKPSGPAADSPTYAQWALFSVSAPLVNAFQKDAGGKESVLKVQSTGEGELMDLIEDFSDGRIQFSYVKVKDPNSGLPKNVLIAWCGEGVPERTKGYFTSHFAAVEKVLRGSHVQITARSDRDLTPESIVRKVSESSGSNYSGKQAVETSRAGQPPPPPASKPVFTPTRTGGGSGFNPLAARGPTVQSNVDKDGWGDDAPPVTRSQLERVQSAYTPTRVNMKELTSQREEPLRLGSQPENQASERSDVVRGGYQPIGKVDIAALRKQAKETGNVATDDRPATVKGAYEPVGKVDIAAIRARAQPPSSETASTPKPSPSYQGGSVEEGKPLGTSSGTTGQSERLTSLPKPKVGGMSGSSAFRGTKPPAPGGFGYEAKPASSAVPAGGVGRTFADQAGKTPAQLWAERKARERGMSGTSEQPPAGVSPGTTSPTAGQKSGGEWKSGYTGKSWAPVQMAHATGQSAGSGGAAEGDESQEGASATAAAGAIGALRDRFGGRAPEEPSPPPLDISTKPNAGPRQESASPDSGLPTRSRKVEEDRRAAPYEKAHEEAFQRMPTPPAVPRSPTPPTPEGLRSGSPIRIAMPVGRSKQTELEAPEERFSAPPIPADSTARMAPQDDEQSAAGADEPASGRDPARGAAEAAAATTFGQEAAAQTAYPASQGASGKSAVILYEYEKAESNEIELREGEYVTNIEMVDDDWWMGQNSQGEMGLFPSNYVELVEDDQARAPGQAAAAQDGTGPSPSSAPLPTTEASRQAGAGPGERESQRQGPTATALYDYEAAEPNELSFVEGTKITGIEFPDDDWWFGHVNRQEGLFPANYVELDQ
ncbi:MAG: hypothetical protein M1815_001602 [Lichina confinis]|nr:MAG: hypothetical protein M1815_001602 [Lichina confinis]